MRYVVFGLEVVFFDGWVGRVVDVVVEGVCKVGLPGCFILATATATATGAGGGAGLGG